MAGLDVEFSSGEGAFYSSIAVDATHGAVHEVFIPEVPINGPVYRKEPPVASRIQVNGPDENGIATITGGTGAADGLASVSVINLQTGQYNFGASNSDGSFAVSLFAPAGSWIGIHQDPTGQARFSGSIHNTVGSGTVIRIPVPDETTGGFATGAALSTPFNVNYVASIGVVDVGQIWLRGNLENKRWQAGQTGTLSGTATIYSHNLATHLPTLHSQPVYLEMVFDAQGRQALASPEQMSHILAPTGFPIERRRSDDPVQIGQIVFGSFNPISDRRGEATWRVDYELPDDLPWGVYQLVLVRDPHSSRGSSPVSGLDQNTLFFDEAYPGVTDTLFATGGATLVRIGSPAPPRVTCVLGLNEFSNGSRGTVALEDRDRFGIAGHIKTNSKHFILPLLNERNGQLHVYRLEPFVPLLGATNTNWINPPTVPLAFPSGSLSVELTRPDASAQFLGTAPFAQPFKQEPSTRTGLHRFSNAPRQYYGLTTLDSRFEVSFSQYGLHTVTLTGWVEDVYGTRYEAGGTYEIYVARPLDLEYGVFDNSPFEVGDVFSPAVVVQPGVPAEVEVALTLYPNSNPAQKIEYRVTGQANPFGYFNPSTAPTIHLSSPGEYRVDITASYTDEEGVMWMGSRSWGSVVETPGGAMIAHGARYGGFGPGPDQGHQAWFEMNDNDFDNHFPFPYHSGDIAWMRNEEFAGFGVSHSMTLRANVQDTEGRLADIVRGRYPGLQQLPAEVETLISLGEIPLISTSPTQISPFLKPDSPDNHWAYLYSGAARPGVSVREIVSELDTGNTYWRFDDSYNYQLGNGKNGDRPNDFKFLFNGTIYRAPDQDYYSYGAYGSLWAMLPDDDPIGGRIMPPFQGAAGGPSGGPIMTLKGQEIDIFFHPMGVRAGTILVPGDRASFSGQIGPPLDSKVSMTVTSPGGQVWDINGQANKVGYFYDPATDFIVAETGVYTVGVNVWHDGQTSAGPVQEPFPSGNVLGSNNGRYEFYVASQPAQPLDVEIPRQSIVRPADGILSFPIQPPSDLSNIRMHHTTVMPGFILEQGSDSNLNFVYDATRLAQDFPNLDLLDRDYRAGADTVTMSFLVSGTDGDGNREYRARQILLQGEELLALPHSFPPTITLVSPTGVSAGTRIQITGTRFLEGNLEVLFDGVSGIDVEVVDDSTILVTVPELPAGGPVTITVTTDQGFVTLEGNLVVEDPSFGPANLLFTHFANGEIPLLAGADWEVPQGSIPNRTRIILINNSDEADSGVLRFRNAAGNPIQVQVGGIATDTLSYSLGPWSTTEVETDGTGDLQTGTIEVISSRGEESSLEGTEAFEILGNFVSVASSPRRSSQQVYVSVTETENTGVALLNPDQENAATLDATLLDNHNEEKAEKEIVLEGGQQLVAFVDQADLFADFFATQQGDFQGRLKLTGRDDQDLALLGLLQKRATAALIAISTESEADPGRLIFTQFANGALAAAIATNSEIQQDSTDARTRLILINDGEEADTGTIRFQNASGALTPVPIQGEATDTVDYSLDEGTTAEVETDGTGALQSGVIEVNSDLQADSKIVGSEVFEILGNFVSVTNSPPRSSQQAYVSVTAEENTGVALYNPDSEDALTLTLILVDSEGNERAQKQVMLDPAQQLVQFVDQSELFSDFFATQEENFKGTLNIHVEEGKRVAVLGLLQKRASGALIAVSTSPNAFGAAN